MTIGRILSIAAISASSLIGCSEPQSEKVSETPKTGQEIAAPDIREVSGSDVMVAVFDKATPPDRFATMAKEACGSREFCQISGWTDGDVAPRGFPFTDEEVQAQSFSHSLNRATGHERSLWNCEQFAGLDPDKCMAR